MTKIKGTSANDTLTGTIANDEIILTQGGNDKVDGGDGNDVFKMGAAFTANDKIDGDVGIDRLWLNGDYSSGITFKAATMAGIEQIVLIAGHDYSLKTADANIAPADLFAPFTFDATRLGAGDHATFNASLETDSALTFRGGAGDDVMYGGQNTGLGNTYYLSQGGNDTVHGGKGSDYVAMGGKFTAADHIDGGTNSAGMFDQLVLNGKYSGVHGVTFGDTTLSHVAIVNLVAGHDYTLKIADGTFGGSTPVGFIRGDNLGTGDHLVFNGSLETDAKLEIHAGASNDKLTGGAMDDYIFAGTGSDVLKGGAGNDLIILEGNNALSSGDRIDGGSGTNTLQLDDDQSVTLTGTILKNIQSIIAASGDFAITLDDSVIKAGHSLNLDFTAAGQLQFDGSAETNGTLNVYGTAGDDIIVTGAGDDTISGSDGKDAINAGAGADTIAITFVNESRSSGYDTVTGFESGIDKFAIGDKPNTVDAAITGGHLDTAHFDADMTTVLTGLQGGHAVLFTADSGTLSGRTFLVVNAGGGVGYHSDSDYIVDVTGGDLASFTIADFA